MAKAVFFDVGNTLLYPYPSVSAVCKEVLAEAGYDYEAGNIEAILPIVDEYYEDRYREDDTFWTSEQETSDIWTGMYAMLLRKLGVDEDAEDLAKRVYDEFGKASRWRAYDDVKPAMWRLKEHGLKLGVISNWDRRLESLLDGMGIGDMLDTVISSAAVGLHKPDPRIFELATRHVRVEPADCVHIGDHHYADILGARSAGMEALLIDRHDNDAVDADLRTLDELDGILGW